jgi:four helix bundle protein
MYGRCGYRELQVWQTSMDLVVIVYEVSRAFPEDERFGLRSQIRRAAISVPSNVAEGYCRRTTGAYAHHVTIALGSQGEIETFRGFTVHSSKSGSPSP